MKQTLALRMGQQLAMTPQLQQAIRLMQLSALELKTEVRQTIEANPMLDLVEETDEEILVSDEGEDPFDTNEEDPSASVDQEFSATSDAGDLEDTDVAFEADVAEAPGSIEEIPDDLPVDVTWDDVYQPPRAAASAPVPEEDNGFEERNSADDTSWTICCGN